MPALGLSPPPIPPLDVGGLMQLKGLDRAHAHPWHASGAPYLLVTPRSHGRGRLTMADPARVEVPEKSFSAGSVSESITWGKVLT